MKYCLGLAAAARNAGVILLEHSPAYRIDCAGRPLVKTTKGEVCCARIVLVGNVYVGEYGDCVAPSISARITPVGTYMLATEPLGAAHADASMPGRAAARDNILVLDDFRLSAGQRLLFGAGETAQRAGDLILRCEPSQKTV